MVCYTRVYDELFQSLMVYILNEFWQFGEHGMEMTHIRKLDYDIM